MRQWQNCSLSLQQALTVAYSNMIHIICALHAFQCVTEVVWHNVSVVNLLISAPSIGHLLKEMYPQIQWDGEYDWK